MSALGGGFAAAKAIPTAAMMTGGGGGLIGSLGAMAGPISFGASLAMGGVTALLQGRAAKKTAKRQNQAISDAAVQTQERLNDYITQVRVDRLRSTEQLAREAMVEVGNVMNVMPDSISAIETVANRIVTGVAADQFAIEQEATRRIAGAEAEKQNVVNQAESGMVSPGAAAFQAGSQGFAQGLGLGTSITDFGAQILAARQQQLIDAESVQQSRYATNYGLLQAEIARTDLERSRATLQYVKGKAQALFYSPNNPYWLGLHTVYGPTMSKYLQGALAK